jgi:hypothetical protein
VSVPTCSRCGGKLWVRYFSETIDGDFEEAFRLCPCAHESEACGERAREGMREGERNRAVRVVCSLDLKVLSDWLPGAEG